MTIRPITPDETPLIAEALLRTVRWREEEPTLGLEELLAHAPRAAVYLDDFGRVGDAALIATEDGQTQGLAWYRQLPSDQPGYGFVHETIPEVGIAVWPAFRRRGIGGKLLDALKIHAAREGFSQLSLSVSAENESALALYAAHGFRESRREGIAITMVASTEPRAPSLYEWAGGGVALRRLTEIFYAKVPLDPILAPVFAHMPADHPEHVAAFVGEVLGGPPRYTSAGGSHAGMVEHHHNRSITEEQRRRWVDLLLDSADEAGLPDDPEFRSAFVAYIEWGTRLAKLNSQPDVPVMAPDAPMPTWGWGVPGGPYRPD